MARTNRDNFHSYANEHIVPNLFSGVFKFPTLLSVLSMKGSTEGKLGRPGSSVMLGKRLSPAKREEMRGSTQYVGFFHSGTVGGGKWIGEDDTAASAGAGRQNKQKKSFYVSWAEHEQPIAIQNTVLDANQGKAKIGSVLEDAVSMAVEEQIETFATSVYTGAPSDQTAEVVDNLIGLDTWIHDSNTLGGVDRSLAANANFRGRRSTATLALSLKLIDDICIKGVDDGASGTTTPLLRHGSKADIILTDEINYNTLKQEAISRQLGRAVSGSSQPSGGQVGFVGEYIDYNGKCIAPDPYAAANSLYILDSSSWLMQFFGGKNFSTQKFVNLRENQPGTGQPDLTTSAVVTKGRLICPEPWKNFHGTAVS